MSSFSPHIPNGLFGNLVSNLSLERNGTNEFEYTEGNSTRTILASAQRSADTTSSLITNPSCRGAIFYLNVSSAFPGSGSTTVAIVVQGKDPVGGGFVTIASSTARSASGTTALMVYPGIENSGNFASKVLPREFQVIADMSTGATSKDITFSIGMQLIK